MSVDGWMGGCLEQLTENTQRSKFTNAATVFPHLSSEFSWKYHVDEDLEFEVLVQINLFPF